MTDKAYTIAELEALPDDRLNETLESRPLKTRPHSAPTGAAFGFCYAPPLAHNSESTND